MDRENKMAFEYTTLTKYKSIKSRLSRRVLYNV